MKSNYAFLNDHFPMLAMMGSLAEDYLYTDGNSCLMKLGLFGETMVNLMMEFDDMAPPAVENTHANRIKALKREGLIAPEIDDIFYALRKARNRAVHEGYDSFDDAVILLEMAYKLGGWFMQIYGDWQYQPESFVLNESTAGETERLYPGKTKAQLKAYEKQEAEEKEKLKQQLAEKEALIEALQKDVVKHFTITPATPQQRLKQVKTATDLLKLSEAETRYLIDAQLRKVGWAVDTISLTHANGARPQKGKDQAIAEWPTDSTVSKTGYADYALFVGTKLVGIIEAKRTAIDIPSVIDYQCKSYAQTLREADADYFIGNWNSTRPLFSLPPMAENT